METPTTFANHIGLILAFVIGSSIFIALIIAATTQRQTEEQHEEVLFGLGFTLATPPPEQLIDRIAKLPRLDGNQEQKPQRVFRRPIGGGEIYLLTLPDADGTDNKSGSTMIVAATSTGLDLPQVTLIPRHELLGRATAPLPQLAQKAIRWAAARAGVQTVTFEGDLEFDEAFITLARTPMEVHATLTDHRRTALLEIAQGYTVDVDAQMILLIAHPKEDSEEGAGAEQVQRVCEDAQQILAAFSNGAPTNHADGAALQRPRTTA
jgi:hypothetical protein